MKTRYEVLRNEPEARRWVALFRAGAGTAIAIALTVAAFTAPHAVPGDTVAVEIAPAASLADIYDGPETAAWALPVLRDEFSNFDQLYPHAYAGQAGVLG